MPNLGLVPMTLLGGVVLDLARFEIRVGGQIHGLTMLDFRFLKALADRPDQVVTWERLYEAVYDTTAVYRPDAGRLLRKIAGRLREILGFALATARGVGYRLVPEQQASDGCGHCGAPPVLAGSRVA